MSRRSGLGRGLAALIPPAHLAPEDTPDPEPEDTAGSDRRSAARTRVPGVDAASPDQPEGGIPLDGRPHDGSRLDGDAHHGAAQDGADHGAFRRDHLATGEDAPTTQRPTGAPARPSEMASGPPVATVALVSTSQLRPNPRQPREVFDEDELIGLATSLEDVGMLQPLVVRPAADGDYELVAGERRLRAARLANIDQVPVLIRHTDDADLLKEALIENIHRVQLNPLEEAAAYEQLLREFGFTQEELATRLGRSRPSVTNTLRLLGLPPRVQRRVAAGVLSAGHAKALLAIEDPGMLEELADRVVVEGMSVRATEELVRLRLGEGESPVQRRDRRRRVTSPALEELQDDLSEALMTRVRISMGARKGKLAIDVDSIDELERIVAVIAAGLLQPLPVSDDPDLAQAVGRAADAVGEGGPAVDDGPPATASGGVPASELDRSDA